MRQAAALAALGWALVAGACGGKAGDLLAVERDGTIPGARLDLRFTVDGRVSCNRGELVELTSAQVIAAREIERALGEPARARLDLPPGPGSILRYRARLEAGAVRWSDTSRRQPPVLFRAAKLARDVAKGPCGLPR